MKKTLYIEGGGNSKKTQIHCQRGFHRLLETCGFSGRMPKLVACGGRDETYGDFKTAHNKVEGGDYVALLVDSEDPVSSIDKPWEHLSQRDKWITPNNASDDQALLMTTCMETWIVSDRGALRSHYGANLQETALPALSDMESRPRGAVQNSLARATRNCKNAYMKGKRSFELLGKLSPACLHEHLPSFRRVLTLLTSKLRP